MTWYVICDPNAIDPLPTDKIWTISRYPNKTGWNTDSGYEGYGLTKADAEELAIAANALRPRKARVLRSTRK